MLLGFMLYILYRFFTLIHCFFSISLLLFLHCFFSIAYSLLLLLYYFFSIASSLLLFLYCFFFIAPSLLLLLYCFFSIVSSLLLLLYSNCFCNYTKFMANLSQRAPKKEHNLHHCSANKFPPLVWEDSIFLRGVEFFSRDSGP